MHPRNRAGKQLEAMTLRARIGRTYELMREGRLQDALELLEEDIATTPSHLERDTLRYLLYRQIDRHEDALHVTENCLQQTLTDVQKSTWLLRQGFALLELRRKTDAARTFHAVMSVPNQKDHHKQAREALLRLTELEA